MLTRRRGETKTVGGDIAITTLGVHVSQLCLDRIAPKDIAAHRKWICEQIQAKKYGASADGNRMSLITSSGLTAEERQTGIISKLNGGGYGFICLPSSEDRVFFYAKAPRGVKFSDRDNDQDVNCFLSEGNEELAATDINLSKHKKRI